MLSWTRTNIVTRIIQYYLREKKKKEYKHDYTLDACCFLYHCIGSYCLLPQWGAADAEIKVPSDENTELKRSPFKAWSRSAYSHTCYVYCRGFLLCLLLPFRSIHLHFFQNLLIFPPVLAVADTGSCAGPQSKIGHPAGCGSQCWVPAGYK